MDFMSHYNQNKKGLCRLVDNDYPIVIWHDGTPTEAGTAVTAATVEGTADTSLTLKINAAVDTRIGTSGVLAVSTYTTFLLLAQNINAAKGWHCQLVDARGADTSGGLAPGNISATSVYKTTGLGIKRDSDDKLHFGVGLVDYGYGTASTDGGKHINNPKRQAFLEHFYSDLVFNDGAYLIKIYDCDDTAGTDELIYEANGAATTVLFSFPTNGPTGFPIMSAKPGHRLLVHTLCDTAANPDALSRVGLVGSIVDVPIT